MHRQSARDLAAGCLGAGVAGVLVGVLGTFKHQVGISATTKAGLPIGLVLSLAMVAALLVALRLSFPSRALAITAAIGVIAAVGALSMPGPSGGDEVVLQNWAGYGWLGGVLVVAAAVVGWPRVSRRRPAPDGILDDGAADPLPTTSRSA